MTLAPAAADDRSVRVIRPTQSLVQILSAGLKELWSHKSLFLEMTRLRLKVRYKQSLLGWTWAVLPSLESVRKDHVGLHSFLSMSLIDARRRNARPRRLRFSQSLARRLHRPSHANVRSTTHRLGKTMKPFA